VQDIRDTLDDTRDDFETAAGKLAEYFQPQKNNVYNIYQFRQIQQEQDETCDDYCTRLKQAAKLCEFPKKWQDTEIQLQHIDKGKSKRIRRQLLRKEHTIQQALEFARAQEIADSQATRIERGVKNPKPAIDEVYETRVTTKNVKPVAQQLRRRIPFSVRPKIEEEVRRWQEEDIIVKIDKPTSWISPTVITPKKNPKEIRLNVDTRVANGAIPRVNSITPTIDELTQELNGAQVFSHLYMNYGYH
jgi:transcriptional regulator with XRE-family HTH domain